MQVFRPKFFTMIKSYNTDQFIKDLTAGIIVAIIALPLSIALAIASGVSPERGLYTAIIAGFLISFLGGSRVQIGGPTGAFMIIVYGIVTKYGMDGLIISTIMAGILLILMGVLQLGNLIRFIPYPITTGFTGGIALVIFTAQIKDFLGISAENLPAEFIDKWIFYFKNVGSANLNSLILGIICILIIALWPKLNKKIPGSLIALIVATAAAYFLKLDVETIGSKYGELSSSLPMPSLPNINLSTVKMLIQPAVTIALLGGIESLLSAVVADGMIGGKHRSNTELIAQGIANIASGVFGGIPATGAIARTAANIKNGGRTPVAGIVHSLVLLLIMLLFMPLAKLIPLCSLSAILMVVAYNMSEWRAFRDMIREAPKSDAFVLLVTFILTVVLDLVIAIEIGMFIASLLFMKRMADTTKVDSIDGDVHQLSDDVLVYEMTGPFFFGAVDKFMEVIDESRRPCKTLILNMSHVPAMDVSGYRALMSLYLNCKKHDIRLIISDLQAQPYSVLEKAKFIDKLGNEGICESLAKAAEMAS